MLALASHYVLLVLHQPRLILRCERPPQLRLAALPVPDLDQPAELFKCDVELIRQAHGHPLVLLHQHGMVSAPSTMTATTNIFFSV